MQILLLAICLVCAVECMKPDDVKSFFLKAPKSVPRAGRSTSPSFESFFLKASKSVPRVGRRDPYQYSQYSDSMDDELLVPEFYEDPKEDNSRYVDNYYDPSDVYQQRNYYEEPPRTFHRTRRYNPDPSQIQNKEFEM